MSRSSLRLTVLSCALLASCAAAAASAAGAHQRGSTDAVQAWAKTANGVCRVGIKMYPSIRLGSAADPDTMAYAVDRLVREVSAIPDPGSKRFAQLGRLGSRAAATWDSIATTPIRKVSMLERRAAAQIAAHYVDRLVALGARACVVLRPRV